MYEPVHNRCPYLGLQEDPETALGYPSIWNCCHHVKSTAVPSLEHQREVCLGNKHSSCPVFSTSGKNTLPKKIRMSQDGRLSGSAILRWGIVVIILTLIVGSSLILSGYWTPSWMEQIFDAIPIRPIASSTLQMETPSEVRGTETPESEVSSGGSPSPPPATIVVSTQTELVQTESCAYPLETPIGTTQQLILHKVTSGESMAMLAGNYQTTKEAIDAINYFLPSPLWSELVVVIPFETTSTENLSPLKPVFVEYENISIEELAGNLSVSVSDIMALNALDPACQTFSGWILIPAEKISLSP